MSHRWDIRLADHLSPLWPRGVIPLCGALAGVLGLVGLTEPAAGAALLALGAVILTEGTRFEDRGRWAALLAASLGLAGFFWLGVPPGACLGFILAGIVLFARRWPRVHLRLTATAAAGSALLAQSVLGVLCHFLAGYLPPDWGGGYLQIPLVTAMGFLAVGMGHLALAEQGIPGGVPAKTWWLPFSLGMAVLLATSLLRQAMVADETDRIQRGSHIELSRIRSAFMSRLESRLLILVRIASQWERLARPAPGGTARHAIGWMDLAGDLHWLVGMEGAAISDLSAVADPGRAQERVGALGRREITLGSPLSLPDGTRALTAYYPFFTRARPAGLIVGIFRFSDLLEDFPDPETHYVFALTVADDSVFKSLPAPARAYGRWRARETFPYHGVDWELEVWPTAAMLRAERKGLPDVVLAVGSILAALLALTVLRGRKATTRASDAEATTYLLAKQYAQLRRMEDNLRASEEQFRAVAENAWEAVVSADGEGNIVYFNPAAERIFGYRAEELIGQSITRLMPERYRTPHQNAFRRLVQGGKPRLTGEVLTLEGLRKDGTEFPIELSVANWKTARGSFFSAILRDVTERKRSEEAVREAAEMLRTAHDELEKRVRERTNELSRTNRELREAKWAAEEASRLKSQFVANVSHEIRTPINAVIGTTGLLEDTRLTKEQREYVRTIHFAMGSLLSLINDLLDFSKMEAGKMALEEVGFSLEDLASGLQDSFLPLARQKGIRWSVTVAPDVPGWVVGDPGRLRQVLTNLAANALKFTERGEVSLRVTTAPPDDAGRPCLRFDVTDTGVGIPEAAQAKLFQPFSQADNSLTRRFGGTGLGLCITKRLVDLMNGNLSFESREGKGSRFRAEIPLAPGERPAEPELPRRRSASRTRGTGRILVVDDTAMNLTVTTRILEKLGYRADPAGNGKEAILALQQIPYDLVLMDCQMPEMDGYQASREIRSRETGTGRHVPIIAMTAHAMAGEKEKCLDAGMDDYLAKPVSVSDLSEKLRHWLRPKAVSRESSSPREPRTALRRSTSRTRAASSCPAPRKRRAS